MTNGAVLYIAIPSHEAEDSILLHIDHIMSVQSRVTIALYVFFREICGLIQEGMVKLYWQK